MSGRTIPGYRIINWLTMMECLHNQKRVLGSLIKRVARKFDGKPGRAHVERRGGQCEQNYASHLSGARVWRITIVSGMS